MDVVVRMLGPSEWRLWSTLRLAALAESPDSFGSTLVEEEARPDAWWVDLVASTATHPRGGLWCAEVGETPAGMTFGRLTENLELLELGAMWVAPGFRRLGIGTRLVDAAYDWARSRGAVRADLWVTEGNAAAESFYASAGFHATSNTKPLREGSDLVIRKLVADL